MLFAVALGTSGASAAAIGGEFSSGVVGGLPNAAMVTFKLDHLPVIGIGLSIGGSSSAVSVTADWWLYHQALGGPFYLYIGPGLFADEVNGSVSAGGRLPIGLQYFVIKPVELFAEVAPTLGVTLGNVVQFPTWGVQGSLGFRYWF